MNLQLHFANIEIKIVSERDFVIDESFRPFLSDLAISHDILVRFSWDWDNAVKPTSPEIGRNLIQTYHVEGDTRYCITLGGYKGPLACAVYTEDLTTVSCTINEKPFVTTPNTLSGLFRTLPLRAIFDRFSAVMVHAAQIEVNGKGILFAAPSGTGKTTQAGLWQTHRGAEIICNDRTILRYCSDAWCSFGFAIDGSAPINSDRVLPLGAIVLLEQGQENWVVPASAQTQLGRLLEQAVIDTWDSAALIRTINIATSLIESVPVFRFSCTASSAAVDELEAVLIAKEVI